MSVILSDTLLEVFIDFDIMRTARGDIVESLYGCLLFEQAV